MAKLSLAFLWFFTGLTSLFFSPDLGFNILSKAGFDIPTTEFLIYCGSITDIVVGLWILTGWKVKACYISQIIIITAYSILLTVFDASYWLHPFGPLTKNLPIIILILLLIRFEQSNEA